MVVRTPEHEVFLKKRSETHNWQMTAWCTEKFGKRWSAVDHREGIWCCFWAGPDSPGDYRWCFTNEQDMVMFVLRWA